MQSALGGSMLLAVVITYLLIAALYESFLKDLLCCNRNNNNVQSVEEGDGLMGQFDEDGCGYFNKWWQKTIAITASLGFYYFLYDYVSQPLLETVGCCSNIYLFQGLAMGVLVLHFFSGISLHLYQEKRKVRGMQDKNKTEWETRNALSERDWVKLEDSAMPETGISTLSLPSVTSPAGIQQPIGVRSDPVIVPEQKKRGFWPFRKKEKSQALTHPKAPGGAIVS